MKFLHPEGELSELTYTDVFLMPRRSGVASRMEVDLTPPGNSGLTIPVVVANMTAVAGRRMAETTARRGGVTVLPQDIPLDRIEHIVRDVKKAHHVFETPVTLDQNESIQTALNLIYKRSHGAVVVTDTDGKPIGIFTEADARRRDKFSHLSEVMTTDMVTVPDSVSPNEAYQLLFSRRLSIVPVIGSNGQLVGVLTKKGAVRATVYTPATNMGGQLLTAAAVGINTDIEKSVSQLLEVGVDIIVLDTAHGHQEKMIEAIRIARRILGPERPLAAGNVVTSEAVEDFIDAGASIIKVGVGPGAMCTTRMMTGMGRPQFSAVRACATAAHKRGAYVWADGGVRYPRDVALGIAAGASAVMIGTWFAGTYESPADTKEDEHGRLYKENFGMASQRAVANRTRTGDPFEQAKKQLFEEGRSESHIYLQAGQESVEDIIDSITSGLRSACTYAGAHNLQEFQEKAVIGVQTQAGFIEGKAVTESW